MSTDRLNDIKARTEAANRNWRQSKTDPGVVTDTHGSPQAVFGGSKQDHANAAFTAHAPEDVRWLVEQLEQARNWAVELENRVEQLTDELKARCDAGEAAP